MDAFFDDDLWMLSRGASVQRVKLYAPGIRPNQKVALSETLHRVVREQLIPRYRKRVDEDDHCANIEIMIKLAGEEFGAILHGGRYRYSSAQKLLNLYLKYQWCLGRVAEPPHCPVDRIVLSMTNRKNKANWIEIDSRREYMQLIEAIRDQADRDGLSIAEWEMTKYRRRQTRYPA